LETATGNVALITPIFKVIADAYAGGYLYTDHLIPLFEKKRGITKVFVAASVGLWPVALLNNRRYFAITIYRVMLSCSGTNVWRIVTPVKPFSKGIVVTANDLWLWAATGSGCCQY